MPKTTPLVFPELPEKLEPAWVKALSSTDRLAYDRVVEEGFRLNVETFVHTITNLPGFESVPPEAIEHLAARWAITYRNGYDDGWQDGHDWRKSVDAGRMHQLHSFAYNSIQNVAGG
jgi:hypothetical protein